MKKSKSVLWLIIVVAVFVSWGCATMDISSEKHTVGELKNERQIVDVGDAQQVRAVVKIEKGDLEISNGTEALVTADFMYNVAAWKPEVTYSVADGLGRLTIRQPNTERALVRSDTRTKWELMFNEQVPLDLRLECGNGSSYVNLGKLRIETLDVQLGVGDMTLDLSGNESLRHVEFDVATGNVTLNLDGAWQKDVNINFQGGVGQTTLRLPKDIGVRINVNQALGRLSTRGLLKQENSYVNAAYGTADVTLEVNIQAGVGDIVLEVVD